jgi:hypothetical protein
VKTFASGVRKTGWPSPLNLPARSGSPNPAPSFNAGQISRILRADTMQRQDIPGTTPAAGEPKSSDPLLDGLKTMAEHLPPKLTDPIKEGLKNQGEAVWSNLSTGEKFILIGWGVAALGTALPPLMLDQRYREGVVDLLEGQNLAVLLRPIPYNPLEEFSFQRPAGEGDPLRFNTSLTAKPVLDLLREENPWIPDVDVAFRFQLAVNPETFSPTLPEAGLTIKGSF